MSDEAARGNAHVPVHYHQFDISDEDGPTRPDLERGHNALVRVTIVITGIHTGDVDVTVTLHKTEPAPDNGNWQRSWKSPHTPQSGDLGSTSARPACSRRPSCAGAPHGLTAPIWRRSAAWLTHSRHSPGPSRYLWPRSGVVRISSIR
jgi:hypothetical protein